MVYVAYVHSAYGRSCKRMLMPLRCLQPEMVGHYLGEFSITYKPVRHGRAGLGSTTGSRFIPLK